MNNEEYWYWICNIENVWNSTIRKLLEIFKSPKEIYECSESELSRYINSSSFKNHYELIRNIVKSRNECLINECYNKLHKREIYFISIDNEKYPDRLRGIDNYPYGIYVKGNISALSKKTVAIVGARNCTTYGKKIAKDIGFELAANGVNVISGLARGIDSAGLWGAVDANGVAGAVLGCGVDICYPRENIELYEVIKENGFILSDYPIGTKPLAWQFPLRNRIISGLADIVLVVEARERSGSLITVEYALEQGKDVCAVPGRVGDGLSSGCNRLIKEGAAMVLSANDVLHELGINNDSNIKFFRKNDIVLEKEIETLYSYVDFIPKNIQQLMNETGMSSSEILRGLIKLQMMNYIEEPSKNYYSRKI